MFHPPYRRRHRFLKAVLKSCLFIGLLVGGYALFEHLTPKGPDINRINGQTFLKEKTFDKPVRELQTKSGLPFWLIEDHEIPIISISFEFDKAGAFYDPTGKEGLASLAADILPLRTEKYNRFQMNELADLNAVQIGFSARGKYFSGHVTAPSENLPQAVEMLSLILTQPAVDEDDLRQAKQQALTALNLMSEQPNTRLHRYTRREIFGNHPYARDQIGTAEGINNVLAEDILSFAQTKLSKDSLIIGVSGDLTPEHARQVLDEIFATLPQTTNTPEISAPTTDLSPEHNRHFEEETAQIGVTFTAAGTTRQAEDFYPLYVANHIFGGAGLTSRLSLETREKRGLTYGIYTALATDAKAPLISGSFSSSAENDPQMRNLLRREWLKFGREGASREEFNAARNYLLASFNLRFSSTAELAGMLVLMQRENLGADFLLKRNDFIRALTLHDVNMAAQKYFSRLPREISLGQRNNPME